MSNRTCSIEGCERPTTARGWCKMHYSRWQRTGDALAVRKRGVTPKPLAERFWPKVNKNGPVPDFAPELGNCWDWTGSLSQAGYGQFGRGKKVGVPGLAHRISFMLVRGDIPKGYSLDHLCRRPPCVNPSHLDPVPHRENCRRGMKGELRTHCKNGHPYEPNNTYIAPKTGHRSCVICRVASKRRRRLGPAA